MMFLITRMTHLLDTSTPHHVRFISELVEGELMPSTLSCDTGLVEHAKPSSDVSRGFREAAELFAVTAIQ